MTHTQEQKYWLKMRDDTKRGKGNAAMVFPNLALTVDGQLCIGMTHNKTWSNYSCSHLQTDGARDFSGACTWDLHGNTLDGLSDLNLGTVNQGIRTI